MDRCSVLTLMPGELNLDHWLRSPRMRISLELVAGEGFDPPRLGGNVEILLGTSTLEILRMGNISSLMPTAGTRESCWYHSGAGCSQRAWLLLLYRCRWTISIFFFFVYSLCFCSLCSKKCGIKLETSSFKGNGPLPALPSHAWGESVLVSILFE